MNDEGQFGYTGQKPGPHLGPSWSLGLPELSVCVTDIIIPTLYYARIHIGPFMISLHFILGKRVVVENLISLHEEYPL